MSEPTKTKRVAFVTRDGQFGTVDEADAGKMPYGTRILTAKQAEEGQQEAREQAASTAADARYDALPTGQKALGIAASALSTVASSAPVNDGIVAPPTVGALGAGVFQGFTGGLGQGAIRQGVNAIAGQEAGDKYADAVDQQALASPTAHGIGNVIGTVGGLATGVGEGAEALAGAGLAKAGLQGTSVLGKAGLAAAKLGARGLAEGAVIGGGEYAGEALLQDKEMAADKLFSSMGTGALYGGLTSAVLGGGLSLAGSGLGRFAGTFQRAADAAPEVAEAGLGTRAASGLRGLAEEQAAKGALPSSSLAASELQKLGRTGPEQQARLREIGRTLLDEGITTPLASKATQAERLATRATEVGEQLDAIRTSLDHIGAKPDAKAIVDRIKSEVLEPLVARPFSHAEQASVEPFVREIGDLLDHHGDNLNVRKLFEIRSALDKKLDPKLWQRLPGTAPAGAEELGQIRGILEGEIERTADRAAQMTGGDMAATYRKTKSLYADLATAKKWATKGAARESQNRAISLTDTIMAGAGIASGHGALAIGGSLANKAARTYGNQAAAFGLDKLSRLVAKQDLLIDRASKGLLSAPVRGVLTAGESMPAPSKIVPIALARVAAFQADPEAFVDHAAQQAESLSNHSPDIANGIVQRQVRAMTFLAGKVPTVPDPDPLDPHPAPKMTATEAAEFGRYAWYTDKPERFFKEITRGKVTFEGAETAQALMPTAFQDLQNRTTEQLATMMGRGKRIPYNQREYLGVLLDIAAVPAQRQDHAVFLQQNVSSVLTSDQGPGPNPAPAKSRAASNPSQRSKYDELEANGIGR